MAPTPPPVVSCAGRAALFLHTLLCVPGWVYLEGKLLAAGPAVAKSLAMSRAALPEAPDTAAASAQASGR